jgi:hypothetical protein
VKRDGTACADADCVDEQQKFWNETDHTYSTTALPNFVCKAGYEMGNWSTECTAGVNTREVTETICRKKFLKITDAQREAGIAKNKVCIKNIRPSPLYGYWKKKDTHYTENKHGDRLMWYQPSRQLTQRACQIELAKNAEKGFKYAIFRAYSSPSPLGSGWGSTKDNCYLARGDWYSGELFIRKWNIRNNIYIRNKYGTRAAQWLSDANWKTFQTSCDLNSTFAQAQGTNPARVVMKYKQTRKCTADGSHSVTHFANVFRVSEGVRTKADQKVSKQESPLGQRDRGYLSTSTQRNSL